MPKFGLPEKLSAEHHSALSAIVEANWTATLDEIAEELKRRVQASARTRRRC
jgi:hypothetical protein